MAVDIVHKPQKKKLRSFGAKLWLGQPFLFYKGNPKNIQRKMWPVSVFHFFFEKNISDGFEAWDCVPEAQTLL